MVIPLITGQFTNADAMSLLTQMIDIKIKYHENKIDNDSTEEDIKSREAKIIQLQRTRSEVTNGSLSGQSHLSIIATATIS